MDNGTDTPTSAEAGLYKPVQNSAPPSSQGKIRETGVLILCLAIVFLLPPIILIFNKPATVLGIPISAVYLFAVWILMILASAFTARRFDDVSK